MPACPHHIEETRPLAVGQQSTYQIRPLPDAQQCDWTFTINGQDTRNLSPGQVVGGFKIIGTSPQHVTVEPENNTASATLVLVLKCGWCAPGVNQTISIAFGGPIVGGGGGPGALEILLNIVLTPLMIITGPLTLICAFFGVLNDPKCLCWLLPPYVKQALKLPC